MGSTGSRTSGWPLLASQGIDQHPDHTDDENRDKRKKAERKHSENRNQAKNPAEQAGYRVAWAQAGLEHEHAFTSQGIGIGPVIAAQMTREGYSWGCTALSQVSKVQMNESQVLCELDEIPDAGAISVLIESSTGGFQVILLRQGDRVFGYHNECPHQGRNLDYVPGKFMVRDGSIMCAAHGAMFAVDSGDCLSGPCSNGLARVPVRVEAGKVVAG